ncbi:MAG: hypothetical protein EHM28_07360 [Spirochaetaceae bacterium]|nr:MAG: hypothetical protein EHM28_07360 [Spirochaetaceae bacterium]
MFDVRDYRDQIKQICLKYGVKTLEIFGSVLRDDFLDASDIDLFYKFIGSNDLFARYYGLKDDLESLFKRKVDLIKEENIINPYIRMAINVSPRIMVYAA